MKQRVVLVIGLVVLVVGTIGLFAGGIGSSRVVEEVERSFPIEDGQEILVRSRNGGVTYGHWEGDEVIVRATKESSLSLIPGLSTWIANRSKIDISSDRSGIKAVHMAPVGWFFTGNLQVHFHVLVPEEWEGRISLHTSNGRITARDIHGEAHLRTSNGPIVVERQSGKLEANTSNGRIELNDVYGVVQADTSNGPIRVRGGSLAESGRIRTSNGAIELSAKLEEGANYEVRTSNGRVTLTLIEPDVDVEIRTSNGDIDLDAELAVREFGRSRLAGRIGQGSARLNVRTSNGDVSLAAVGASQ